MEGHGQKIVGLNYLNLKSSDRDLFSVFSVIYVSSLQKEQLRKCRGIHAHVRT